MNDFDNMWRDWISCLPEVPFDRDERDKFKSFAKTIFHEFELEFDESMDGTSTAGYNEGYEAGKKAVLSQYANIFSELKGKIEESIYLIHAKLEDR